MRAKLWKVTFLVPVAQRLASMCGKCVMMQSAILSWWCYSNSDLKLFLHSQHFILLLVNINRGLQIHYNDVIMEAIASQITSLTIIYSIVYSDADQRKHQSSASLAFVWGIHRGPVNSPHKWPVTRKMFPFDDVIMCPGYQPTLSSIFACAFYGVFFSRSGALSSWRMLSRDPLR